MSVDIHKLVNVIVAQTSEQFIESIDELNEEEQQEFTTTLIAFMVHLMNNGKKKGENGATYPELICWEMMETMEAAMSKNIANYLKGFMKQCIPSPSQMIH